MAVIKSVALDLQSGMLLSKEILEQMDRQGHMFEMQYRNYPDGIIYGFMPVEEKGVLYFSEGLIKSHGRYFFSDSRININEFLDVFDVCGKVMNTSYAAMAFVSGEKEILNEGIVSDCMSLELLDRNNLKSDDILIAEFQYHKGKRQWKPYGKNAVEILESQLNEEGYCYSFLNVRYSIPYENVFPPVICEMIKECLREKNNKSDADLMLLFMLSQNQTISGEVFRTWAEANGIYDIPHERKSMIRTFLNYIRKEPYRRKTEIVTEVKEVPVYEDDDYGF